MRGTLLGRLFGHGLFRFIPACAGNTPALRAGPGTCPVHPRLCGEHLCPADEVRRVCGSSPPVRGTPGRGTRTEAHQRFIPACAGNTSRYLLRNGRRPVHPRLCGEHAAPGAHSSSPIGSSPPVRGTLPPIDAGKACCRFIPACAGNTVRAHTRGPDAPVHPRLCGEHFGDLTVKAGVTGSSPPVRGTRCLRLGFGRVLRFIPACAGNTVIRLAINERPPVHPRLCGEHLEAFGARVQEYGSSPPVRGTPTLESHVWGDQRFIPACAGNTRQTQHEITSATVHPRLCGEHMAMGHRVAAKCGSSPPVRGTLPRYSWRFPFNRFIPACAGNTGPCAAVGALVPVHPRLCGEHRKRQPAGMTGCGSSPPVRGTHLAIIPPFYMSRFIPACAGNTRLHPRTHAQVSVHPRLCGEH